MHVRLFRIKLVFIWQKEEKEKELLYLNIFKYLRKINKIIKNGLKLTYA